MSGESKMSCLTKSSPVLEGLDLPPQLSQKVWTWLGRDTLCRFSESFWTADTILTRLVFVKHTSMS